MRPIKFANDKADVLHIARYEYRTCALEHIWPRLLEDGSTYPPDKRFAPVCAGKHKHRRLAILTFAMMLCTLVITGCHGRGHQEPNGQDALARFMRKESEGAHDQRVVAYRALSLASNARGIRVPHVLFAVRVCEGGEPPTASIIERPTQLSPRLLPQRRSCRAHALAFVLSPLAQAVGTRLVREQGMICDSCSVPRLSADVANEVLASGRWHDVRRVPPGRLHRLDQLPALTTTAVYDEDSRAAALRSPPELVRTFELHPRGAVPTFGVRLLWPLGWAGSAPNHVRALLGNPVPAQVMVRTSDSVALIDVRLANASTASPIPEEPGNLMMDSVPAMWGFATSMPFDPQTTRIGLVACATEVPTLACGDNWLTTGDHDDRGNPFRVGTSYDEFALD